MPWQRNKFSIGCLAVEAAKGSFHRFPLLEVFFNGIRFSIFNLHNPAQSSNFFRSQIEYSFIRVIPSFVRSYYRFLRQNATISTSRIIVCFVGWNKADSQRELSRIRCDVPNRIRTPTLTPWLTSYFARVTLVSANRMPLRKFYAIQEFYKSSAFSSTIFRSGLEISFLRFPIKIERFDECYR